MGKMRCSQDELQQVFEYIAAINSLDATISVMSDRLDLIPDSKQTLDRITDEGCDLLTEILKTLPDEKVQTIRKMRKAVRYKIYFTPHAAVDKDMMYIADKDVTELCQAAHEQCKLCLDYNCKQCKYGKLFDRILNIDRGSGCWADIDIGE